MKTIIFLDFDGVLNGNNFSPGKEFPFTHLDGVGAANINDLCLQTGAALVLSTTWRESWGLEDLRGVIKNLGIQAPVIGLTPVLKYPGAVRGCEILAYIRDNEKDLGDWHHYNSYVILDDDTDMLYWQRHNFIYVDREVGVTRKTVKEAVSILKRPPQTIFENGIHKGSRIFNAIIHEQNHKK